MSPKSKYTMHNLYKIVALSVIIHPVIYEGYMRVIYEGWKFTHMITSEKLLHAFIKIFPF
jgi:hypothetical protein